MPHSWIADRTRLFDSSGIRRVFDLGAQLEAPINLSIGQPDFDVPDRAKAACAEAIAAGRNSYSLTQGIGPLRERLQADLDARFGHGDRKVFITSGTSGGLVLATWALVNPGDEVIVFDPYFVMYEPLVKLAGGTPVLVDTYPDFHIRRKRLEAALSEKTKLIMLNSPANPTGCVLSGEELKMVAEIAAERNIALVSDEIYSLFCYDGPFETPAKWNEQTIVLDGFSKSHGMTGWRVGYAHGPAEVMDAMIKLQQYTFVCSPQPSQWGALSALDIAMDEHAAAYRRKRDLLVAELGDAFEMETPGGAFYAFPKAPNGMTGSEFVERAIANNVLIIPGKVFSRHDTHFRLSYATPDDTIRAGAEVLQRLARP